MILYENVSLWLFWLTISLGFLLLEMGSPGLFLYLAFAISGAFAAVVSCFGYSLPVQMAMFVGLSVVNIIILHYWVRRKFGKMLPHERTNVHALIGNTALVTAAIIPPHTGSVKIGGEIWTARTTHAQALEQGALVEVVEVRGAHVVVCLKS